MFEVWMFFKRSSIRSSAKEGELSSEGNGEEGLWQADRVRNNAVGHKSISIPLVPHIFILSGSQIDYWLRSYVGAEH